ncbi:hypothetical protein GV792_21325 [Nocardia cyriacigeorgica]|uniref:Uncharacterized protein n=1 Tax=Nocardia cyriacigeorgica TaxID=135487 RepID=A0A6P1DBD5_9NOCA|nr:hypothetical protein [Nocardia cyriacigeorgica]NEW42454.1 hypothetical protein [Nocardia cyriacigeorgica]NEW47807.1 hypothetical protein [Nocardia cyriacigeorgica]NEW52579.1 hypothetical protein [Nocardia cyriacigeorgica]
MRETSSTLPRRELGRQLREAREGMGMSLEQAADLVVLEFGKDRRGKPTEPTTVFTEYYTGEFYSEKVRTIERYRQAFAALQLVALSEIDSNCVIEFEPASQVVRGARRRGAEESVNSAQLVVRYAHPVHPQVRR